MMLIAAPGADSPSWTDIMTAIGTVGATLAAVGIAWWSHLQVRQERARSQRREQFTEAYAVRVVQGERPTGDHHSPNTSVLVLVATVINGGSSTITGIEVQFCLDGRSLISPMTNERVSGFRDLPAGLRKAGDTSEEQAMRGVLAPWDPGMRSESDEVHVQQLKAHYALVRWTDEWDQRWEHKLGKVRKVREDEEWTPLCPVGSTHG